PSRPQNSAPPPVASVYYSWGKERNKHSFVRRKERFWGAHVPPRAAIGALANYPDAFALYHLLAERFAAKAPRTAREGACAPQNSCSKLTFASVKVLPMFAIP